MTDIVDAHHHIWRQADMPWLSGPMLPRIFGPYAAIRRDYLIDEFLEDLAGTGVVKSVYVQANWPTDKFEDEVAWVTEVADRSGWPHGIVGYADVTVDDVRPQLDRLTKYPLMRGVRMQLHWHDNPQYRFARSPDVAADAAFRRNFAALADYGLSFDLQLFPAQMRDGATLVAENPGTDFILTHGGMLTDRDEATVQAWREGLRALAVHRNLSSKLSGLGTFVHRNDPELIRFIVNESIAIFGCDRLMFGSNFPVEKLWTDHASLIAAHRAAIAGYSQADQADFLWNTAARVYRPV